MDYVPDRIIKADNRLNKIMLSFNVVIAVLYSALCVFCNLSRMANVEGTGLSWLLWSSRCLNILAIVFQVISGLFLFYAIFKIKSIITKEDSKLVNLKTMAIHSVAFGLYMIAAAVD